MQFALPVAHEELEEQVHGEGPQAEPNPAVQHTVHCWRQGLRRLAER